MTQQEFATRVRAKYPGIYDSLDDASLVGKILLKYPQYGEQIDPIDPLEQTVSSKPPEQRAAEAVQTVGEGMGAGALGATGAVGIAKGLEALPEAASGMVSKIKSMMPNPSLKGLGYGSAQVGTEAQQGLAKAAQEYATRANPEIGELVAKAGVGAPEDTQALVSRAAANEMQEPIQAAKNTEIFNKPIAEGMANSQAQMRDLANEQWKQTGEALDRTLQGLNRTGVKYDPTPVLKQVEGMYFKDVNGSLMKTGWQGEANQAISDALESVKDYANGQQIAWDAANQIKSGLQDSASYAAKRFDQANEAYKTVASLIKEDIDNQAAKVLSAHGGDVKDFRALRDAYSKLSSLRSVLNPSAGKELLQPSLAESVVSRVKQAIPLGLTTAAGIEAIRRIF